MVLQDSEEKEEEVIRRPIPMPVPTFNMPPIGPRMGKTWGTTQLVFAFNGVESHGIFVKAGGFCSQHTHESKWNRFYVLKGGLLVRVHHENGETDDTIIAAGQITDVPPGVRHSFEALEDTLAIEYYWTVLEADDIDRHGTRGGVKEKKE